MAWGKAGSKTLTSAGELTDITLSANKSNSFMNHNVTMSANNDVIIQFNNDTANNYADRLERNGTENTTGSNGDIRLVSSGGAFGSFIVGYYANVATEEKLMILSSMQSNIGAGTAPDRDAGVGKWANTSAQITEADITTTSTATLGADSNFTALGSDMTPQINSPAVPAIPSLLPSLQSPSVGGWKEVARTTLSSAGDNIDVTSLPDKRYYMVLCNRITSGNSTAKLRLNNDSGSNYALRVSNNGGTDGTTTSSNLWNQQHYSQNHPSFWIGHFANLASKEKIGIGNLVSRSNSGAGYAPNRSDIVYKWANTSDVISQFNFFNDGTGSYAEGSEVVVLGYDPDDTHTDNFWEELASVELSSAGDNLGSGTFTAKKYLWIQVYLKASGTYNTRFRVNSDSGNTYAVKWNTNGGTDSPDTSQSAFYPVIDGATTNITTNSFTNMYIVNNTSTEKLIMWYGVVQKTGAANGTARVEAVAKWANTSAQITDIDFDNTSSGSYDTGSIIKVWGHD